MIKDCIFFDITQYTFLEDCIKKKKSLNFLKKKVLNFRKKKVLNFRKKINIQFRDKNGL